MIDWRGWLLVVLYQFVGALRAHLFPTTHGKPAPKRAEEES